MDGGMTPPRQNPTPGKKHLPGTLEPCVPTREQVLRKLRAYFSRERMPHGVMVVIVAFTAMAGFWGSRLMHGWGMGSMGWRYLLATLAAWGVFMVLVRVWVEYERRSFKTPEDLANLSAGYEMDLHGSDGGFDVAKAVVKHGTDVVGEGCFSGFAIAVAIGLLIGVFCGVFTLIIGAPALLAEVVLDVIVASFLGRGLRTHDAQWWAVGVVRRTWKVALPLAAALAIIGWVLQANYPGIETLGEVFR
jgi:hypothetical protein